MRLANKKLIERVSIIIHVDLTTITMFNTAATNHIPENLLGKLRPAPLLCWDIAHPMLPKRNSVANDINQIEKLQVVHNWRHDLNFKKLLSTNHTLIVTDVAREIVWTSSDFFEMTGYTMAEAIGKKPAFLQGERTTERSKQLIREKLGQFEKVTARLINYRKDGEVYGCNITIHPLKNVKGEVTHFVAVEKEVD